MKIQTQLDDLIGVLKYCQLDQEKIEKCFEKTLRSLSTHALKKYRKQYQNGFIHAIAARFCVNFKHDTEEICQGILYAKMTIELHNRGFNARY